METLTLLWQSFHNGEVYQIITIFTLNSQYTSNLHITLYTLYTLPPYTVVYINCLTRAGKNAITVHLAQTIKYCLSYVYFYSNEMQSVVVNRTAADPIVLSSNYLYTTTIRQITQNSPCLHSSSPSGQKNSACLMVCCKV